jgi:hypothetical protein
MASLGMVLASIAISVLIVVIAIRCIFGRIRCSKQEQIITQVPVYVPQPAAYMQMHPVNNPIHQPVIVQSGFYPSA